MCLEQFMPDKGVQGRKLLLRLSPTERGPESITVVGDGDFLSDNPAMQKLNPIVFKMEVYISPQP